MARWAEKRHNFPWSIAAPSEMFTTLFEGVHAIDDDRFVLTAVRRAADKDPFYGASVLIAIGNTDGEIYRLVQCQGMRQAQRVANCLRALHFTEARAIGSGYHYIFSR